jgi:alpha-1,6-mannosyltransferase
MALAKPHQAESSAAPFKLLPITVVGLGVLSGLLYLFNFHLRSFFLHSGSIGKSGIHFYVFLFLALSLLYLSGVYLIFRNRAAWGNSKRLVFIIIIFAVLFRVVLVPAAPSVLSKDMYRYIWDGRVQQNGINPYRHPPDADELKGLRDKKVYPNINRKAYPTLYPAGAQLFFRLFHIIVGDRVAGYKGLITVFDVLTLFVLLALLRIYGYEETRLMIYAWNPLVVFEIAYSGHLEGLTVFWMVLALYLNASNRQILGVAALAVSSAIKLYPALLLPALVNRGQRLKGSLAFIVSLVLLYLPFLASGRKVLGFLPNYLQNPYERFNLGLKYLMMLLLPQLDYYSLSKIFLLALAAAGLLIFFKPKQKDQALRYSYILLGWLLVLMPASLHAWYVIILVPFLCFFPAAAWLLFSCMVTLSYLKYVTPSGIMPTSVLLLEYGLLFVLLAGGYIFRRTVYQNRETPKSLRQKQRYFLERHP